MHYVLEAAACILQRRPASRVRELSSSSVTAITTLVTLGEGVGKETHKKRQAPEGTRLSVASRALLCVLG